MKKEALPNLRITNFLRQEVSSVGDNIPVEMFWYGGEQSEPKKLLINCRAP